MKNYINILCYLLIATLGCNDTKSQGNRLETDSMGSASLKVGIDSSSFTYDQFKASIIKPYVDSLNSFRKGSKLPSFLMDTNLDVNSEINNWPNSNFVSLREEIFRKVNNVELLNEIVQIPYFKHQFQDIEKKRERIPSDEVSNYVLAQERLNELAKR